MTVTRKNEPKVEFDWMGRHGTAAGTIAATWGILTVTAALWLAKLGPEWSVVGAGAGALATYMKTRHQHLTRATQLYRLGCWFGVGIWGWWVLSTEPWTPWGVWSATHIAALAAGGLFAGIAAPAFMFLERRQDEYNRQLLLAKNRTKLAVEWEQRLARVTRIKGCVVEGIEQWPEDSGYELDVALPEGGTTWKDFTPHLDGLASDAELPNGCGVEVDKGVNRRRAIFRVSTVNVLEEHRYLPNDFSYVSVNDPIWIGWHRDGTSTTADIRQATWLYVGMKGSGKTTQLHVLISQLARCVDAIIWVLDLNGGGLGISWATPWWQGRCSNPAVDWIAANPEEAYLMTEAALAVALDRKVTAQVIKTQHNVTLMPVSPDLPEIIIVGDEIAEVIGERVGPDLTQVRDNLEQIIRIARDAAVNEVLAALRATSEFVDPSVKSQCEVKVSMGVSTDAEIAYLMDWGTGFGPEDLPTEGCGILKPTKHDPPRPYKGPDMLPNQIFEVAMTVADRRPQLNDEAVAAMDERIGEGMYEDRWERARPLFYDLPVATTPRATTGAATSTATLEAEPMNSQTDPVGPGNGGGDDDIWERDPGSLEDAFRRGEQLRDQLAREADELEGKNPNEEEKLRREFEKVTAGLEEEITGNTWDDPDKWPGGDTPPPTEEAVERRTRLEAEDRALGILRNEAPPEGLTPIEIAQQLREEGYTTHRGTVQGWLKVWVAAGKVEKVEGQRGSYRGLPE